MEKTLAQQLAEATTETQRLQAQVTKLEGDVKTATDAKATAEKAVETANAAGVKLQGQIDELTKTVTARDQEIVRLKGDLATANAKAEKTEKVLNLHPDIKALFHDGEPLGKHEASGEAGDGKDFLAQYNGIKDPVARAEFWRKHQQAKTA